MSWRKGPIRSEKLYNESTMLLHDPCTKSLRSKDNFIMTSWAPNSQRRPGTLFFRKLKMKIYRFWKPESSQVKSMCVRS